MSSRISPSSPRFPSVSFLFRYLPDVSPRCAFPYHRHLSKRQHAAGAARSKRWKTGKDTFSVSSFRSTRWTSRTDGSRPIARNDTPSHKQRARGAGKKLSARRGESRGKIGLEIPDPRDDRRRAERWEMIVIYIFRFTSRTTFRGR